MAKIPDVVHESWHKYLQPLFDDPKMDLLNTDILLRTAFYPAPEHIFRVFSMPFDKVKVVILGQDPYSRGEAIGYSFAVAEATKMPASLEIIRKEIISSKVERDSYINIDSPKWKTLQHWRQQGIFLLNAALTVEVRNPDSHLGYWHWFTRDVIKIISTYNNPVWIFWGSKARAFKEFVTNKTDYSVADFDAKIEFPRRKEMNYYMMGNHPAAEAYPDSKYKFTGCNHFNICNDILKAQGKTIINW